MSEKMQKVKRKQRARQRKMKTSSKVIIAVTVCAAVIAAGLFGFYKYEAGIVYKEIYLEAGSEKPDISEFLKRDTKEVSFGKGSDFDTSVVGDYKLTIKYKAPLFGTLSLPVTLHVTDTTAPVVEPLSEYYFFTYQNKEPEAKDLLASVSDATEWTAAFSGSYDFTSVGEFDVEVIVTDAAGNSTTVSVPCKVVNDTTAPVISGVEPLSVSQGDTISYTSNVTVTDDYDKNPTLEVDTSEVNPDKRGIYNITYIATDASGNKATATTTIQVKSMVIAAATESTVNGMADEILSQIIHDGMSQLEQARAVFDWVVNNITYSESAGIDDLYSAAYKGMYNRVGDCTVKQKTAEVMLNRLGIKNMEIEKIRDTRGHYWLLIDVGEGWYHYDPNAQLDGSLIFYWHDADLWAYSNTHGNTHNYDKSKYPTIQ